MPSSYSASGFIIFWLKMSHRHTVKMLFCVQRTRLGAKTGQRFISAADGGQEGKKAGKLISNMFTLFTKAKGRVLVDRKQWSLWEMWS